MSIEPGRHSAGDPEPDPDETGRIMPDPDETGRIMPDPVEPDPSAPAAAPVERHMSSPPRRGAHRQAASRAATDTSDTAEDPVEPDSVRESDRPPGRQRDGVGRTIVRGVGQTLITLGVIVLLFVVYEVYVTDLFGKQKQAAATEQLDETWAEAWAQETTVSTVVETAQPTVVVEPSAQTVDPAQRTRSYDTTMGEGFAKLYVPAFGPDYVFTVIEGVEPDDLYVGPGHYPDTQYPGEKGNFAVAGHRVSKGSPFNDLGLLASCDAVVVETNEDWFVYRVLPMADEEATWATTQHPHCEGVEVQTGAYAGVYGRFITYPADYNVVRPVPGQGSDQVPEDAERLITLTTCHPQFSDAERMIVHATLVRTYAKADGFLPPELQEG